MPYVNPELRSAVPMILKMGSGSISAETLPTMRKMSQSTPPLPEPGWNERTIPCPTGAPDVRLYTVNANAAAKGRPAILHIHGGGFVAGNAKSSIRSLQPIAQTLDCVIVSVDYRLAPETPFPGPVEDCYAALLWLHRHATELGADPARIAVMGESAGGGLAAMLAITARDRGEVALVYQALTYPMLDDRTGSSRKTSPFQGVLIWNPGSNRFGWTAFLGKPAGSPHVPYGAVPARVTDLQGLPPAFIGVGSIDLFVDEDIDYARRLVDSGVGVDLLVVPGCFHGFDNFPGVSVATNFRTALVDALRRGLSIKT